MKRVDKTALERYQRKLEFARSAGGVDPFEQQAQKHQRLQRAQVDIAFMVSYYFAHYATAKSADFQIRYARRIKKNPDFKGFCQWGRGLAKSVWNTLFIPFWLWINHQPVYFVLIGNTYQKATQLLEDLRAEFEANPRIQNDFGPQQNPGKWEDGFFVTSGGFIAQALGMGQSVRGLRVKHLRPTFIVADDLQTRELLGNPQRTRQAVEWILRDLIPCMDGPYRRFSYCGTRHAEKSRMIQTLLQEEHPSWHVSHIQAYDPVSYAPRWPDKYHRDYYKDIEKQIGRLAALAEYCHRAHAQGHIFKREHIQWAKPPRLDQFSMLAGYWDVAYAGSPTADYNAVVIQGLHRDHFYEISCFVKQCKMKEVVAYLCDFQKRLPASLILHWLFESQFWNDELRRIISETEKQYGVKLNMIQAPRPRVDKYNRILSLHPYFQNGRFYYDQKNKGHGDTQVGLSQLLAIEPGYKGHDDYPDAKKGCTDFLEKHRCAAGQGSFVSGKMKPRNRW